MNPHHIANRWLVTGPSRSGKSTLAMDMARRWRNLVALLIFDPDGHWTDALPGVAVDNEKNMARAIATKQPVCFKPRPGQLGREAFPSFCRASISVGDMLHGPKLVVIDEVQKYQQTGKGGIPYWLEFIADDGRKREMDMVLISQAPNRVHDVLRNQLTGIFTFRFTDKLPLKWLTEQGFDRDRVATLPEFKWMAKFNDGSTANGGGSRSFARPD